jgi:tetratricopeptide (TPR) repeat protein
LLTNLPAWVTSELSRLIPELANTAPAPMSTESDKIWFFEALCKILERCFQQGIRVFAVDDLHFMDATSFEALQYSFERLAALGGRTFIAYRTGELSAEIEASLEQAASHGLLEIIDLMPLEEQALLELLSSLRLEAPDTLAAQLQRATDGNPLFALEIIRDLLERNQLFEHQGQLPLPKIVRQIILHRLERRSLTAQRVAQVAAIAGTDFTLELAAYALECKPLELQDTLEELEKAQIMRGERFQHDLLQEAVRAGISSSIKRFLHRKCANFLEKHGDPTAVAQHWLEALEYNYAVPAMISAAEAAQGMGRNFDAIDLLEQAISLPAALEHRHRAQALLGGLYVPLNRFEDAERTLKSLLEVVSDPEAHWLTLDHLCYLRMEQGLLEAAHQFGLQALALAELHGVASQLEDTRYKLGAIAFAKGDYQQALGLIEPVVMAWRTKPVNINFLNALAALAQTLYHLEHLEQAQLYEDEMLRKAKAIGAESVLIVHATNLLYRDFIQGDTTKAIKNAQTLLSDLEQQVSKTDTSGLRKNLAAIYARNGQTKEAILQYEALTVDANSTHHCAAWANLAVLHETQSKTELAKIALARALELAPENDFPNVRFAVIRAALTVGTVEQRALVQPYLEKLNFDTLPPIYRTEIDALLRATAKS